jgi:hypothetical protein
MASITSLALEHAQILAHFCSNFIQFRWFKSQFLRIQNPIFRCTSSLNGRRRTRATWCRPSWVSSVAAAAFCCAEGGACYLVENLEEMPFLKL